MHIYENGAILGRQVEYLLSSQASANSFASARVRPCRWKASRLLARLRRPG